MIYNPSTTFIAHLSDNRILVSLNSRYYWQQTTVFEKKLTILSLTLKHFTVKIVYYLQSCIEKSNKIASFNNISTYNIANNRINKQQLNRGFSRNFGDRSLMWSIRLIIVMWSLSCYHLVAVVCKKSLVMTIICSTTSSWIRHNYTMKSSASKVFWWRDSIFFVLTKYTIVVAAKNMLNL